MLDMDYKECLVQEGELFRCLKYGMTLTNRMKVNICDNKAGCEECDDKRQEICEECGEEEEEW